MIISFICICLFSCFSADAQLDISVILSGAIPAEIALIGVIGSVILWKGNIKVRRADYIRDLIDKMYHDKVISSTLYDLQYNNEWYTMAFHNDHEIELRIDTTLSYFSYICYLHKMHIIKKNEFNLFKSMIVHISNNKSTIRYFYNLKHYSKIYCNKNQFQKLFTFKYLFNYMKRHNACFKIKKQIFNKPYKKLSDDEKKQYPYLYKVLNV